MLILCNPAQRGHWWSLTHNLMQASFGLFLIVILASYVMESGTGALSRTEVWRIPGVGELPAGFGYITLFAGLIVSLLVVTRVLGSHSRPVRWSWGRREIALPLLALTVLVAVSLHPDLAKPETLKVLGLLGLTWIVYLYLINERPNLALPLSIVLALQGMAGVGQFLLQRDLGLVFLGEPTLDPMVPGVSILMAMDTRWLRAYGLTGHPNLLGATLVVALLLLIPVFRRAQGGHRAGLGLAIILGLLGLLVSFSRAAWLGFAVGMLLVLIGARVRGERRVFRMSSRVGLRQALAILFLVLVGFLARYHELVTSRFLINSGYTEVLSLSERLRDSGLALQIIAANPWRGTGAGNYLAMARALDEGAQIVHNVPLLAAAELGIPGVALWLWLVAGTFRGQKNRDTKDYKDEKVQGSGELQPHSLNYEEVLAPWAAFLVIGLFDYNPWPFELMRGAILFGLLTGRIATPCHYEQSNN